MIHLRSLTYHPPTLDPLPFPFNVSVIRSLTTLEFTSPITFLVGENGSGKSTLLEAIACAVGSITVGSEGIDRDESLKEVRTLAKHFKLTWNKKTRKGFFMRSEDFFGYAKRINQIQAEMHDDLREIDETYRDRSQFARDLARSAFSGQLHALNHSYGTGLDAGSHGESFFKLFNARFVPDGLYLLDEPEAPLSPTRQLAFMALLHQMIGRNAQLIIATHSPILLAYPNAVIWSCDGNAIESVRYDDLEHVTITRDFLQNPEAFLKHLLPKE